ncbi:MULTISPECIES: Hsp20/alpha crystallin family protein [unclassified Candidatus Frackibacter]|uniref:Hsp20/alpha crystallin family protein n=1 Tax=unclassified Candidatus Frackibacter TaxID=2648818 RepID=UPI00088063D8|nr:MULTISPECIES: Hsp20/alpha crystallin family protein [unclassified Candidatus Frackibacter]SDC45512.1 HSP20 family protein [Candidatus Frackibacter sp. WG11]SEM65297.1 HSP20 family protein [Candidatus Frackibacter sp. WG12]SFL67108.1 HSP20 family protein [Candidatus Frackibacter sp. WG13]
MSLIPHEPFRHLENIRREFDRFFTNERPGVKARFGQNFGNPDIDIYEKEGEIIARCDIPGLEEKEDVNIEVDNNLLIISGAVNKTNEIEEEHLHRQERFYGRFQRSINLPTPVSPEGVEASYKNGVLEIHMPKLQSDTRKRIDVDFH